MTTYEPSTVELADDSPEALYELFETRGLGDGLPWSRQPGNASTPCSPAQPAIPTRFSPPCSPAPAS